MSLEDYTEEYIQKLIITHQKKLANDRHTYLTKYKNDKVFQEKNRAAANDYYRRNKEKIGDRMEKNKEKNSALNSYRYYKKTDRIDLFKNKHPEKYDYLVRIDYIKPLA